MTERITDEAIGAQLDADLDAKNKALAERIAMIQAQEKADRERFPADPNPKPKRRKS